MAETKHNGAVKKEAAIGYQPHRTANRNAHSSATYANEHQILSRKMADGKQEMKKSQKSCELPVGGDRTVSGMGTDRSGPLETGSIKPTAPRVQCRFRPQASSSSSLGPP
jgi:hypothetical protein